MTKFVIFQDGCAIFAVGESREEAIDDLEQELGPGAEIPEIHENYHGPIHGDFYILPATDAVYNAVINDGGAIEFEADIETQKVYLPEEL
jgi:hypothetical protein